MGEKTRAVPRVFPKMHPAPILRPIPSGGHVSETPQLLATNPVRKHGGSHVVSLAKPVREALDIRAGDQIAFRKVGRYVFIAVIRACAVAPVTKGEMQHAREILGV